MKKLIVSLLLLMLAVPVLQAQQQNDVSTTFGKYLYRVPDKVGTSTDTGWWDVGPYGANNVGISYTVVGSASSMTATLLCSRNGGSSSTTVGTSSSITGATISGASYCTHIKATFALGASARVIPTLFVTNSNVASGGGGGGSGDCMLNSSTTQVLFNLAGTCAGDAGLTYVAASDALTVVGATTVGSLKVPGSSSGLITLNTQAAAGTWTFTLPITDGDNGQFLQTNGSGVTTWAAATVSPGSPDLSMQYNSSGSFAGASKVTYPNDSNTIFSIVEPGGVHFSGLYLEYNLNAGSSNYYAQDIEFYIDSAVNLSGGAGIYVFVNKNGVSTATNIKGAEIGMNIDGASGAVTNAIGIDISGISGATNNFALRTSSGLVSLGDFVQIANGKAIQGDATTAHTWKLGVYDVNGTAYRYPIVMTNGDAPDLTISIPTTGTTNITATNLTATTALAFTGAFGLISSVDSLYIDTAANNLYLRPAVALNITAPYVSFLASTIVTTSVNNGDAITVQAYDVDGVAYASVAKVTNGNVPDFDIKPVSTTTLTATALTAASGTPSSICQNAATKEVTVNAALTCTVSARDQKTAITPLSLTATDLVRGLQPVSFAYIDNAGRNRLGFIAEDVAAVDPRFGDAWIGDDARSIDLPALLAVSVKAIQELEARVKELEAR